MGDLATVDSRDLDGARLVLVSGEVDLSNVARVTDAISAAVPGDAALVFLDLSSTTYLDSSGISMIFRLSERLGYRRQELRLVVPADAPIRRVLEITNVDQVVAVQTQR